MLSKPRCRLIVLGVALGIAACPAWVLAQTPFDQRRVDAARSPAPGQHVGPREMDEKPMIDPPFLVRDLRVSETNRSSDPRGLVVMGDHATSSPPTTFTAGSCGGPTALPKQRNGCSTPVRVRRAL